MNKLLLVVDLQNDFINENTKFLKEKIKRLITSNKYNYVVFSQFINSDNSKFVKQLNWNGCLTEDGKEIAIEVENGYILRKDTYTCLNYELVKYIDDKKIDEIYICGIDTECCILKTAFDFFEKDYNFYILKNYCASTHGENRHNNAIEILKRNIGNDKII